MKDAMLCHSKDVLIGFLWAALVIAVLFFSGGSSNFIYVDF